MLGLYFLIDLGYNVFYTAFPLHAISTLNWSIAKMGVYFTLLSGLLIIVQSTILPRVSRKHSDTTLIIFGNLVLGTNFLLLIPGDLFLTYLAAGFFALGDGLMWPSFLSLLSKLQEENTRVRYRVLLAVSEALPASLDLFLEVFYTKYLLELLF